MYKINKEKVRKILVDEMNYTPYKVDLLLKDYPSLRDQLGEAVEQWLKDRTVADVAVEGFSIKDVMEKRQVHFLVAVKKLNILLDKSIPVEERDKLRKTLSRQVVFK